MTSGILPVLTVIGWAGLMFASVWYVRHAENKRKAEQQSAETVYDYTVRQFGDPAQIMFNTPEFKWPEDVERKPDKVKTKNVINPHLRKSSRTGGYSVLARGSGRKTKETKDLAALKAEALKRLSNEH